ncbi:MAG: hypothetical protein D6808_08355 [Candidatus Dadabacteria bacterium]|nr:MAG: hypothetical protein D6808_08355 [Candidatus Dadabacteria bacterium]
MAKSAGDRIVEGLTELLAGFSELEEMLEDDYGASSDDEELSSAVVNELVSALDTVIDTEDYTPAYIASVVSALSEALEDVAPDIFDMEEDELEDELIDDDLAYDDDEEYFDD